MGVYSWLLGEMMAHFFARSVINGERLILNFHRIHIPLSAKHARFQIGANAALVVFVSVNHWIERHALQFSN